MRLSSRKIAIPAAAACLSMLVVGGMARAEVVREGTLQAAFNGNIAPAKLPRTELAPVTVQMGGKIKTTDRSTPPKLERIILDINSHGVAQNQGTADLLVWRS